MSEEAEIDQKLSRLKATRKSHRGVVTRYVNEVNGIVGRESLNQKQRESLSDLKKRLEQKLTVLETFDTEITAISNLESIDAEITESETISFKVVETMSKIDRTLTKYEEREARIRREISPGAVSLNSATSGTRNRPTLPRMDLQKFSGDTLKFMAFWDRFEVAIDKNEDIPKIEKFNYLCYYLEGAAARIIDGLQITDKNYDTAKEMIKKRYGRPQMVIAAHMEELLKLKPSTGERATNLRYVFDKISVHLRGLENLGISSDTESTLIPVLMSKLPSDIRVQVARLTSNDKWSLKELLKLLQNEVEAREIGESVKVTEDRQNSYSPRKPSVKNTAAVLYTDNKSKSRIYCVYCNGAHFSASCEQVKDVLERKNILKQTGKCFICLRAGHRAIHCTSGRNCRQCNNKHHQSICDKTLKDVSMDQKTKSQEEICQTTSASTTSKGKTQVLLQTARAIASKNGESKGIPVRILLDSGSQRSYVTEAVKNKLKLEPMKKETLHLNTFGGENVSKTVCSVVKLHLKGKEGENIEINASTFPVICSPLPSKIDLSDYPHLEGLELSDPLDTESEVKPIDILIGADVYWDIINDEVIRDGHGPIAVKSKFGWIVSGPVKVEKVNNPQVAANLVIQPTTFYQPSNDPLITELKRFWDTETLGIYESKGNKDRFLEEIRHDGERYEVGLPWKGCEPESLPDDYNQALNRLNSLYARLEKDNEVLNEYDKIIDEQLNSGIIEIVPVYEQSSKFFEENEVHYLPHFGVTRKDRETTKLRIVFDGSAKSEESKLSLNDYLENGPNFIPPIFDVLIKFRSKPIALVADIEKAFLQISIKEKDRDALRFLWYRKSPDGTTTKLIHLRFRRLVFGLKSSPSILGYVINEHLGKFENVQPEIVKLLKNQLFVDDLAGGANSVEEGFQLFESSKEILKTGGFNLRKWKTNNSTLLKLIQNDENDGETESEPKRIQEEDGSFVNETFGINLNSSENMKTKILGLNWDIEKDEFYLDFNELIKFANSLPHTKRSVLSLAAKMYDPLGFLTPFTVQLKEMFQKLCTQGVNWDDELQGDIRSKFNFMIFDMQRLHDVKIPRCLFEGNGAKPIEFELHGFSDASSIAYGACVYLTSKYDDGSKSANLIASKTRIAPIKEQTMPRLELLGALILSRLMESVCKSLENALNTTLKRYFWVDSCVVLCWIRNEKIWTTYVQNRINEIRSKSKVDEWGYCPGSMNPADLPSRGVKANTLVKASIWWNGPDFLKYEPSHWPEQSLNSNNPRAAFEETPKTFIDKTHVLSINEKEKTQIVSVERFSSKTKLIRTVAWVLRFIRKLKEKISKSNVRVYEETLDSEEISRAEKIVLKQIQKETFSEEINYLRNKQGKAPKLVNDFNLFIDNEGILRTQTRLQNGNLMDSTKRPILLPKQHDFTTLVIREVHSNIAHSGVRMTLSTIRERFWILRGRESVKRVVRHCRLCKWFKENGFLTLPSLHLPKFRIEDGPPFLNIGLDFAGPLFVRNKSENSAKCYISLFTCATTRAVHLELTEGLDVENFLRAFRRFATRRGLPRMILSDNAKTFKSASKEIRKIARSKTVLDYFANREINWKFIPELSPWFGGMYERMVGSVKRCLRRAIGRSNLNYDEIHTIIVEIEGIVNSRPISYVYDDSEGVSYALTPSHLIYGRRITTIPSDTHFEIISTHQSLTKRAKHHRQMLANFTEIWRKDYLLNLRERASKQDTNCAPNIKVGDVVVLKNDKTKRIFWKLGRIESLLPGKDGQIRVGTLRVLNNDKKPIILKRSITSFVPLEVDGHIIQDDLENAKDTVTNETETNKLVESNQEKSRTRRTAAIIGEIVRKENTK